MAELPRFLKMKDGIIRPFHVLGTPVDDPRSDAYQSETAQSIYDYFDEVLDQRGSERRE